MPLTTYVSIGNSDDKLSQSEWAEFYSLTDHAVRSRAAEVYGAWVSEATSRYQNACWAFLLNDDAGDSLRARLAVLAARFRQDAITAGSMEVEFIGPAEAVQIGNMTVYHTDGGVTVESPVTLPPVEGPLWRPSDWEHIFGVKVHDPDGWRTGAGMEYGPRDWHNPISEAEWVARAAVSTINRRPLEQSFHHNPWDWACSRRSGNVEPTHPRAVCRTCRDQSAAQTALPHINGGPRP